MLYQKQENGNDRVMPYASHTLSETERCHNAHKFEFLALKWSITDCCHEYFYCGDFEVFSYNNPLTYILTTVRLDVMGQRWVARSANFNFCLHYKSGKQNVEIDVLSCIY